MTFLRTCVVAVLAMLAGSMAHALTIDIGPATVSCYQQDRVTSAQCRAFTDTQGSLSFSEGTIFQIGNSSERNEAAFLNTLLDNPPDPFDKDDVIKTENSGENRNYFVNSRYFSVKLGAGHAYFVNDEGERIYVVYAKKSGKDGRKGGLSHESQYGGLDGDENLPPAIPLPPSVTLLLAGLAGLGGVARLRRRRRAV